MDTISYKEAAKDFESAFPIGNGRLGATVYGGIGSQVIALNEESLWSSPFIDRINRSCRKDLPKVTALYADGHSREAQELVKESFAPVLPGPAHYKSAGSFRIDFFSAADRSPLAENILAYERTLDMETGIASESFALESPKDSTAIFSRNAPLGGGSSVSYSREVFASACNDVIAIHIEASLPRNIFLRAGFESDGETRTVFSLDEDTIVLERLDGVPMCAMAMACATGGSCCVKGGSLIVEGADDVTIYIDIETAYRSGHYRRRGGDVSRSAKSLATSAADKALKKLCIVQARPYQSVLDDHASRFSRRYRRLSLQLADKEQEAAWKRGRYRMLSSFSTPGTLPPLKTGLWTDPAAQEAEPVRYSLKDLSAMPFLEYGQEKAYAALGRYLKALRKRGFRCAKAMFQDEGSLSYTASDIWGDCAPSTADENALVPLGAIYAALLLKKYYDYTLDRKFLKKHLRLLTGPCAFFAGFQPPRPYGEEERELIRKLFEASWEAVCELEQEGKYPELHAKLNELAAGASGDAAPLPNGDPLVRSIIRADMLKGKVEIALLSGGNLPISSGQCPSSGELKGLHLPGNLRADVHWENGSPKGGRIYARPGCTAYAKSIVLSYGGKSYPAEIQTGSIDILNILPSTV